MRRLSCLVLIVLIAGGQAVCAAAQEAGRPMEFQAIAAEGCSFRPGVPYGNSIVVELENGLRARVSDVSFLDVIKKGGTLAFESGDFSILEYCPPERRTCARQQGTLTIRSVDPYIVQGEIRLTKAPMNGLYLFRARRDRTKRACG